MIMREFNGASFKGATPFDHLVIDDFLDRKLALQLEREFPDYNSDVWHRYDNAIEVKRDCNTWRAFPASTYSFFTFLNSQYFCTFLAQRLRLDTMLFPDPGLHGGGWHAHTAGGKLNTHLDYNLHPKLKLQRKVNLIIYLNSNWLPSWGGELGFWGPGPDSSTPGELATQIEPLFNRAVLFDTTGLSWHGLPKPIQCPEGEVRKSIATYYLERAPDNAEQRVRGLFVPSEDQKDDPEVAKLIADRVRKV